MRFAYLIAPTLLLAACGQEEKSDAKSDTPDVSINARGDGGNVEITSGKDGGKVRIGGDKVAINIDIPDFVDLDVEGDFDIDGVPLYPDSKVTKVDVNARDRKDGAKATVTLGFTSPATPKVAADWMAAEFAKKGKSVTRSGNSLSGTDDDGDAFTIDFRPDGDASKGEVRITKT